MPYKNKQSTFQNTQNSPEIFWQKWMPEGPAARIIVYQHGIGEYSSRYDNLLKAFENESTLFYALDARGHGRSGGKSGHVDSFQLFADDLGKLIQIAQKENPGIPVYLLGHSSGSLMALLYVLNPENQNKLAGLLLSSPPIKLEMNVLKKTAKIIVGVLSLIIPSARVKLKMKAHYFSHSTEVIEQYKTDQLILKKYSMRLGAEIFSAALKCMQQAPQIKLPIYIWHGLGDKICMPEGSQELYDIVGSESKTLKFYDELYHDTMNEKGDSKWRVLFDVKSWLNEQQQPI